MRRQPSRRGLLHLLTLLSMMLSLASPISPTTHAFAAASVHPSASAPTLLAPTIPDPLVAPVVDPARAAVNAALGSAANTLLPYESPARLEPLASVAPAVPSVVVPAPPDPLAHMSSGAPQSAGIDTLAQQRAHLAVSDLITPTMRTGANLSTAPPVSPTVVSTPVISSTTTVTPVLAAQLTVRVYLPLVQVSGSPKGTTPAAPGATPTATSQPTMTATTSLPATATVAANPPSATTTVGANPPSATATAAANPPSATATVIPSTPVSNTALLAPNQSGSLRTTDGRMEVTIPAGAVSSATTIHYQQLVDQAVPGFRSAGVRFELTAVDAQGNAVHQFQQELTLRVQYVDQAGVDPASLKLYFTDATHPTWTALPTTVDTTSHTLVATSNHFTTFAILSQSLQSADPTPCELAEVGKGADPTIQQAFITYCDAQGLSSFGGKPLGHAYDISGAYAQNFPNGALLYVGGVFFFPPVDYVTKYKNEGGPAGWLGAPQTGNPNPTQAVATFTDENGHNFVGQDVFFLAKGFISKNGGTVEAHRFFPVIPGIGTINVTGKLIEYPPTVPGDPTIKKIKLTFSTGVDPAPLNPSGATAKLTLIVEAKDKDPWTESHTLGPASTSFSYPNELDPGTPIIFSFKAARTSPGGDNLVGYAPCTAFTQGTTYPLSAGEGTFPFSNVCEGADGSLPPPDTTPPVIHYMDLFQDGNGQVEIRALVTDNRAVGTVEVIFNGTSYPMHDIGGGIYSSGRLSASRFGTNTYRIHATDTSANAADFPSSGVISVPAGESRSFGKDTFKNGCPCGFTGTEGDPVNTQSGDFTTSETDVIVAGIGSTLLDITRSYNSLAAFGSGGGTVRYTENGGAVTQETIAGPPQPFGRAWTFAYAERMLLVDNLVMQGAQIFYPDGRVVSFRREGIGFAPITPFSHDQLVAAGAGYELRHKGTLEADLFDGQGRLVGQRDRNGNAISLTYSGDRLTSVTNASGRTITFEYNGDGYITAIHAPEGKILTYAYTNGDLTRVTDARGNATTYTYNADHQLTQITTPKGHPSLRLSYDDQYRVKEQTVGETERYAFNYSADGSLTTLTDAKGNQTWHSYDADGRLVVTKDALGFSEQFGYDAKFNRTSFTDRLGRVYTYTYDDRGNKLTESGPLGWHRAWTYNDRDQVTHAEDANGHATDFAYDDRGNLTTVTNALGGTSSITYDGRGLPTAVRDFNANQTSNTYDSTTGDLLTTTNGVGDVVHFTYDGLGRVKTLTNGRGFTTTYTYDGNDHVVQIDGPLGYRISATYDKNNNRETATDANGGVTSFVYDLSERLVELKNPLTFSTRYGYDAMGHLVRVEDAEGRVWSYDYDAVYNRIAEHGPEDTHTLISFNAVREVTDIAHCNSALVNGDCAVKQVQHLVYDDLDRVISSVANYVPSAPARADTNVTTGYTYDTVGNLLSLTDPNGNPSTFTYDALNRLTKAEDAAQQITTYAYDAQGNLITRTNPRNFATTLTYNAANRLASSTDALTQTLRYAYDHNGNLTTLTDPQGIETGYAYNALDRLESLTQNAVEGAASTSEQNVTTRFEYDLNGNLRFVHDPRGNYVTEHQYDAANRRVLTIDAEGGKTVSAYDKVDNRTSVTDANGHTTATTFDGLNRPVRLTNAEGHYVDFAYDRLGNLLTLTDARGNASSYGYDGMNRVATVTDAMGGVWGYSHDAAGNLLTQSDANQHVTRFTYDLVNRQISRTDAEGNVTRLTYDANGNPVTLTDGNSHVTTSTYDALDRLATRTNPENETTAYAYNWQGNQIAQTAPDGVVTAYAYDPLYRLSTVTQNSLPNTPASADVNVLTRYTYDAAGNMTAIRDGNDHLTRFAFDGLNRLTQEIDALNQVWDYAYDKTVNRITRIDALRTRTDYTYAPDDQLTQIAYQDGTSVAYTYDENNNRLTVTNQLGTTQRSYDTLNRVVDETDALGRHTASGYDAVGYRLTLTYPDGRVLTSRYAANNWLAATVDPDGRTTSYTRDGVGNVVLQVNPNSTVTEQTYDKADRLLTLVNRQITQPDTDSDDDPTHERSRDEKQGPPDERSAKGDDQDDDDTHGAILSSFSYVYDEVGQRIEITALNEHEDGRTITTAYRYDPLRRMVREETSDRTWTSYRFDAVGNRLEVRSGTHREGDDSADEHHGKNSTSDEHERGEDDRSPEITTTTASYGPTNQLLTLVISTRSDDDESSRATNVARVLLAFRHEVAAQQNHEITTDGATRLLDMTDRLLKDLTSRSDDHHVTPKADAVARAIAALRAEVTAQQTSGAIAHDHVATSLLGRLALTDAANQRTIRIVEAQTYSYDANGNRVNRTRLGHDESDIQGVDYAYDPENRLVTAQDYYGNARGDRANGGITSMAYDGEGRRLVKTYEAHQDDDGDERGDDGRTRIQTGGDNGHEESDQTRVEYVFDGLLPIAEYPITHERPDTRSDKSRDDSHAAPVEIAHTNYYRGDQGRILEQASFGGEDKGQTSWYHYDGLGSVSTLTQRSGERSTTYNYASYGQPKSQGSDSGKAGTHYTFTGQSWDSTTGLYEFYARPYDPATGTWLTQDSYRGQVTEPRSLQRYQYVYNSPVNYYDLYGHWPEWFDNAAKTVGNFVSENKETIAAVTSVVTEVAVGVVVGAAAAAAVTAFCVGTAVVGCVIAAGAVTGAAAAAAGTVAGNAVADRPLNENVLENAVIGGIVGGATAGFGYALPKTTIGKALTTAFNKASKGPWRVSSNVSELISNPRIKYSWKNLFWDDRSFSSVSKQYWGISGGANGNSLQHLFFQNASKWVPRGLRNAGFNLVEIPLDLNRWAGGRFWREWLIRGSILGPRAGLAYGIYSLFDGFMSCEK